MKTLLALTLIVTALTGCVPIEHLKSETIASAGQFATARTAQVTKQLENALPPITVTSSGASNSVIVTVPASKATGASTETSNDAAASSDTSNTRTASSIPLGVKLLLIAAGVAALAGVVWLIKRNSATAAAAFNLADAEMAKIIAGLEAKLHAAADTGSKADILAQLNEINKRRGIIAAQAPPA